MKDAPRAPERQLGSDTLDRPPFHPRTHLVHCPSDLERARALLALELQVHLRLPLCMARQPCRGLHRRHKHMAMDALCSLQGAPGEGAEPL